MGVVPPKDVVLDLVKSLESAVRAFRCGKLSVDVGRVDAVGKQRELERVARCVWQRALAWEALGVEQVGNLRGLTFGEGLTVEDDRRRPGDAWDPARGYAAGEEILLGALAVGRGAEA